MSRPSRHSLRVRLTALVVVLLGAGLLVSSLLATAALRGYLMDRVDEAVMESARPFSSFPERIPKPAPDDDEGPRPPSQFFIAVVDATGTTVISDGSDADQSIPALPSAEDLPSIVGAPITVDSVDGDGSWRLVVTPLQGDAGWSVAAYPLGEMQATVGRLVLLQAAVGIVVVVIAGAVGYLLVRRSLRPLDEMAATAHEIAEGDLSLRAAEDASSTEVAELAASFNVMVTRIEASFSAQQASEAQARASEERMRRFVADAGHELRTPLTSIRGYAELIEQGAAPDPAVAVGRIQDEAARMGALVDELQLLARLDEQRPLDMAPIRLADVVEHAVADAVAAHPERTIEVERTDGSDLVSGDDRRLRQVVDNLLSNAIRYSDDGTPITVAVTGTSVSVTDRGDGLGEAEQARVFDRLYRTDEARTRVRGGSGLGLSIVRSIVEAHGGDVFVRSAPRQGSTFGFTLPADGAGTVTSG